MATAPASNIEELLLMRGGKLFVRGATEVTSMADNVARGFALEAAQLGYLVSQRLATQISMAPVAELQRVLQLVRTVNRKVTGGSVELVPMFRHFPDGVPTDTLSLWWDRVIVHVLQQPNQPCVLCCKTGTLHVLNPCQDIVCSNCFDGSNYSGCPICNRTVDRDSPIFVVAPPASSAQAARPVSPLTFRLLDVGTSIDEASAALFESLCKRTQAMSPVDVEALQLLITTYGARVVPWLPTKIPVRENIAHIFGGLLRAKVPDVLAIAAPYLTTATDVLRLIVAYSGADVALLTTPVTVPHPVTSKRFEPRGKAVAPMAAVKIIKHTRFAVGKLSRSLRRNLLAILDGLPAMQLREDLYRHHARWVWVAEFLHPGEYATRFPTVAKAFAELRNGAIGNAGPATWSGRVERALGGHNDAAVLSLLAQRPGDFVRRLDHVLRTASQPMLAAATFAGLLPATATPALLNLRAHLAVRYAPLPARVYWPKANFYLATPPGDTRPVLPDEVINLLLDAIDRELLQRFAAKSHVETAIIDDELASITVPFNERTASRSAVQLPRGSHIAIPDGKALRLFIHWCEPPGANDTDVDLSVGFFDDAWQLVGTCSYYQLALAGKSGEAIAKSSGDFVSAPFPDGASEFVDFDRAAALANGYRYAVMVVTAYRGLPFAALERATAGVMLRDDLGGAAFDPRTVELAFSLTGDNGVFMPLVVDLQTSRLHWLDAYSKGAPAMNNVANAQRSLATICPTMIRYFATRTRPSMLQLAEYHAAARATRVIRRSSTPGAADRVFIRRSDETTDAFWQRLRTGIDDGVVSATGAAPRSTNVGSAPVLAILHHGDIELPPNSAAYALFRRRTVANLAAADLLT